MPLPTDDGRAPVEDRPATSARTSVSARFRRTQRVRKSREFRRVQDSGQRVTTTHFVVLGALAEPSAPTEQAAAPHVRLGLVVSRKVGNAVERNRVKRLVRETFRTAGGALVPAGCDVVVIARAGAASLESARGASELVDAWRRLAKKLARR